jgi:arylsulfatase A-like enzyme
MAASSIVLITADCLRAGHVGFLGSSQPTTPFLDSLARESRIFANAFVAGSPTYYSLPALMAARHPLALGREVVGLAPGEATLASVLRDAGWATAAFSAGNPYISPQFGMDQGFGVFQDLLTCDGAPPESAPAPASARTRLNRVIARAAHRLGPFGAWYDDLYFRYGVRVAGRTPATLDDLRRFPAADVLVSQAVDWVASLDSRSFFLWLHLMDCHAPYYPKAEALALAGCPDLTSPRARFLNSYWNRSDVTPSRLAQHRQEIVALYDAGVRWVDQQMACLVESLRSLRRWDDCVFAFTADHGEEFLDHGGRFHPPSSLHEEIIHVPLLLRLPQATATAQSAPFSLVDLAPALLAAAGVPAPEDFPQARAHTRPVAIVESVSTCTNPMRTTGRLGPRALVVREERYKLVWHFDSGREVLYDLSTDPEEKSPIPGDGLILVRRRLLQSARAHLQEQEQRRDPGLVLSARLRRLQLELALPGPTS